MAKHDSSSGNQWEPTQLLLLANRGITINRYLFIQKEMLFYFLLLERAISSSGTSTFHLITIYELLCLGSGKDQYFGHSNDTLMKWNEDINKVETSKWIGPHLIEGVA